MKVVPNDNFKFGRERVKSCLMLSEVFQKSGCENQQTITATHYINRYIILCRKFWNFRRKTNEIRKILKKCDDLGKIQRNGSPDIVRCNAAQRYMYMSLIESCIKSLIG